MDVFFSEVDAQEVVLLYLERLKIENLLVVKVKDLVKVVGCGSLLERVG